MKTLKEWQVERLAEETGMNLDYIRQFMGDTNFRVDPKVRNLLKGKGVVDEIMAMHDGNPDEALKALVVAFVSEVDELGQSFSMQNWQKGQEDMNPQLEKPDPGVA